MRHNQNVKKLPSNRLVSRAKKLEYITTSNTFKTHAPSLFLRFRIAICGEHMTCVRPKSRNHCKFTMVIAWRKQARAKGYFRHESQMGHAIAPFTIVAYAHRQLLHKKKRCGLWTTFFAT